MDGQVDLDEIGAVYYQVLRKIFFQNFRRDDEGLVGRKIFKIILPALAFTSMLCYLLVQALHWNNIEDFSQKMINLALMFNVFSIIIRLIVFCTLPDEMESLFLNFEKFHCNQLRPSHSIILLNKAYKQILNVDFWASTFFAMNVFNWFIFPLFANKVMLNLITGNNVTYEEWLVNVPTSFSFEVQSPWKEIRYILEFIEASIANTIWLTSDVIYYAIVNLLKTQLTLLGGCVVRNDNTISTDKLEAMPHKYFVQDHNKLIRGCKTLEKILSPILGAQLMTTGVLLGGILLTITSGPENEVADVSDYAVFYMKFLVYMAIALLELYLYCWLSDIINSAYEDIGKAVYNSDWYLKLDVAHHSLLSLRITQKGMNITALKLIKINLRTFIEVLRLSYSYFTIMKQRIKNDNEEINEFTK